MAPELITAEEAARLYLTSRAAELTKQIEQHRFDAARHRTFAESYEADADALRNELQGITAIRAAILEDQP